jgi:hypothetical protein
MAIPEIDSSRWIDHCRNLDRLNGGVLAAAASDDVMHGIAIYRPEEDLRLGRIVRVDAMVTFELNPANPVRQALCEAIEALCEVLKARGTLLMTKERDSGGAGSASAQGWESAGFRRQGAALWKPLRFESALRAEQGQPNRRFAAAAFPGLGTDP